MLIKVFWLITNQYGWITNCDDKISFCWSKQRSNHYYNSVIQFHKLCARSTTHFSSFEKYHWYPSLSVYSTPKETLCKKFRLQAQTTRKVIDLKRLLDSNRLPGSNTKSWSVSKFCISFAQYTNFSGKKWTLTPRNMKGKKIRRLRLRKCLVFLELILNCKNWSRHKRCVENPISC